MCAKKVYFYCCSCIKPDQPGEGFGVQKHLLPLSAQSTVLTKAISLYTHSLVLLFQHPLNTAARLIFSVDLSLPFPTIPQPIFTVLPRDVLLHRAWQDETGTGYDTSASPVSAPPPAPHQLPAHSRLFLANVPLPSDRVSTQTCPRL